MTVQRFPPLQVATVSDGSGNATFSFEMTPSTWERWGVFLNPTAPVTALFDLYFTSGPVGAALNGDLMGQWAGPASWGPIIIEGMVRPVILGTGLAFSAPYQFTFWGYQGNPGTADLGGGTYPSPSASIPFVTTK